MALDYEALKNVSNLDINVSRLGAGEQIPENIRNYTRDVVGTTWLSITSFSLFLMLVAYYNLKKNYPISQSIFISSTWTFVVVFGFTITGFTKNIYPLLFYGTILMLSWVWVYQNKKNGLEG